MSDEAGKAGEVEEWRPVVGFESAYSVSSLGRVRSEARVVIRHLANGTAHSKRINERILRPGRKESGHLVVNLSREDVQRMVYVHAAVLEAFVGPCPEGMECCHGDGIPSNNRLSNLRWDTYKANFVDRDRHGVLRRGSAITTSKLSESDVRVIRREYANGALQADLADRFGLAQGTISNIVNRRTWAHVHEEAA